MKKASSLLLTVIMTLAVFGGVTVSAEKSLVEYTAIPGFTAFTEQELSEQTNTTATFTGFSADGLATFEKIQDETWGNGGSVTLYTFESKTNLGDYGVTWSPKLPFESGDIFGDTGLTFEGYDGIRFYIVVNGAPYNGRVDLTCSQVPAKGPYYNAPSGDPEADSWQELTPGFAYKAIANAIDGYVSYDFSDDFTQADWWSSDDEGISHFEDGTKCGILASKLPLVNGLEITVMPPVGVQIDTVAIGDFSIFKGIHVADEDLYEFYVSGFRIGNYKNDVVVNTRNENVDITYTCVVREDYKGRTFEAGYNYWLGVKFTGKDGQIIDKIAKESVVLVLETGDVLTAGTLVRGANGDVRVRFYLPVLSDEVGGEAFAGDVDGDGEITVADALLVLRVAAKLAQPTKSTGSAFDFDGDGEVTVADALSVLRIAAKLA
ncbi:MAG: dockerin type I repeat-containing protein [Paludibacteraceae bacterium]|nr:dockerin type I repeat-containing protein [Paludibacteraceae bacterium]